MGMGGSREIGGRAEQLGQSKEGLVVIVMGSKTDKEHAIEIAECYMDLE